MSVYRLTIIKLRFYFW